MTNEEKANDIAQLAEYTHGLVQVGIAYNSAIQMAKWKDQHPSKETIEKVLNAHTQVLKLKQLPKSKEEVIEGIYNILSK